MDFPLGAQCPTEADFPAGTVFSTEGPQQWSFHRGPGSHGGNAGQDMTVSNGAAVVAIDYGITSDHGAGGYDLHVVFPEGVPGGEPTIIPIGFHAGARLEPGSWLGGPGATYAGGVTFKTVPIQTWFKAYAHKVLGI